MGFVLNTNIAAINSHMYATRNNEGLDKSLSALSSGLRINVAADDAAGMSIANALKSQANGLGQAIKNANDGINIAQTADGALDEYTNIINTVRTKAIQAASDGQNDDSRKAIQRDIDKLLEEANIIATTTSFNGLNLLDGTFQNKQFHVGAYTEETVGINISNTEIKAVGVHVDQTGSAAVSSSALTAGGLTISDKNGTAIDVGATAADLDPDSNSLAHSAESAWAKAVAINAISDATEVTAIAKTNYSEDAVSAGNIPASALFINGIDIGEVTVQASDADNALMNAINDVSSKTNVVATHDGGKIVLTSQDGSDIMISVSAAGAEAGFSDGLHSGSITLVSEHEVTLAGTASAAGFISGGEFLSKSSALSSIDVTSREGAEKAIRIADSALKQLDAIRSDIGSIQNQLESTVRNISVTQVNVHASESSIRDVDFALESANLKKYNILAKAGTYALSQANAAQENISTLLR